MSDPVTNVQIEDVLSSIRRLVSTDDRGESEPEKAEVEDSHALVLTPALRVTGADKPAEEKTEAPEAHHADDQDEASSDEVMFSHHDENATEDAPEQTAEADDGTPVQDVWADEDDDAEDSTSHDAQDHGDESTAEAAQDDPWQDDENHPENDELTARVAGFEEAVAARDDGWEPDGDSEDDNAAQPMESLPWQDDASDSSDAEDAEIVSPTEGLEPFEPEEDDLAPELETPAFAAAAAAPDNAFDTEDDPLGDEAAILDEDALRDLVTDIVREELQGALGERITRNVRKLVRREIHRALATQELE